MQRRSSSQVAECGARSGEALLDGGQVPAIALRLGLGAGGDDLRDLCSLARVARLRFELGDVLAGCLDSPVASIPRPLRMQLNLMRLGRRLRHCGRVQQDGSKE